MNKIAKILFGIAAIVALVFVAKNFQDRSAGGTANPTDGSQSASSGINHLINGDFDNNVDQWRISGGWPATWSDAEGSGAARVAAVSESGATGKSVLSQCVNISGNKSLELGGSFYKDGRSSQEGGGRLRLSWYDQQDCAGRQNISNKSVVSDNVSGWQQLHTRGLTIPAGAQSVTVSATQSIDGRGEFIAYWDNLYLKVLE